MVQEFVSYGKVHMHRELLDINNLQQTYLVDKHIQYTQVVWVIITFGDKQIKEGFN